MITRKMVLRYYHYRCVRCKKSAVVVHEITPRSLRPKNWWLLENRVALCAECHSWAHERGAKSSAEELETLRMLYESRAKI